MFHPRVVLYGTANDTDINLGAKEASIEVEVVDTVAKVTTEVTFTNSLAVTAEALCLQYFMDEHSVLCGFEAQIAGKGIETRVEKLPDEKTFHPSRLSYASEDTPLMFSIKPGSLEAGQVLTAKFSSVTQLNFTEGEIELFLPTLKKQSATIKITKFDISFAMSRVILGVYSTTHAVQFDNDAQERVGTATIAVDDSKSFADLFMTIDVDEALPLVTVQEDEDTGTKVAMVSYQPSLETFGDSLAEVIFMVDRSGSMDKFSRLDNVKKLLPSLFAKLPPNALFNVVGFGTAFESVFRESKEINVAAVEEAYNALSPWEADLGQTQLFGALTAVITNPVKEGFVRHIVIITDGEVEDLEAVSASVQRHASTTTFSVIRIGKDSIENFPRSIARLGHGSCVVVTDERYAELAEKSKDLLDEILRPYIANVTVTWDGVVDDFAPFKPAPIRKGDSITVFGFVQEGSEDGAVKFGGVTSKGPFSLRVPVANSMTATGLSVHRLAASYFVRDLEADQSTFPSSWMIMTGTREQTIADKVWEVSVWNNVPSSVSTFSCFQETEDIMLEQTPLSVCYGFVYDRVEKEEEAPVNVGGSGNFWATFGFSSESVLDKLLDSGEYTLEQLLAEDDLFSEAQSNNENLVNFLNKPRAARKVFNYVSQPSVLKDDPSWHYVYLCTELLALPIWDKALDVIYAPGAQCMDKLVSVLVMPDADEQRIFRACRVFASFMGYNMDRLIEFFKTQKELISALVRHLKTSYIVDLIKALLKPDNGPKRGEILDWLFSGGFFDEVIAQLSPSASPVVQENASDILVALMNAAGEVSLTNRPYESGETINKIFAVMFDENMAPTLSFNRGLDVLNGVVGILEIPKRLNPNDQGPPPTHPTLLLILPHLDKFKKLLTAPPKTRVGTFGEIAIAGELAVSSLRFLLGLVRPRSLDVDRKLIELDILTDCSNMFFRFNLNNFVHTAVEKLFVNILSTYREDPSLKIALLKQTDLPRQIVEGYRKAKSKSEQGYNTGHSSWGGHIYRMSVALVAERYNANISQILDEHALWMEFENGDFVKEQQLYAGWDAAPPKRI